MIKLLVMYIRKNSKKFQRNPVCTYIHMNRKLAATTICYCNSETFVQGTFFTSTTNIIEGQDKKTYF